MSTSEIVRPFRSWCVAAVVAMLPIVAAGCRDSDDPAQPVPPASSATPPASNRIDIPPQVRQNLGITFAKVESRNVSRMLRVPGRFELMPSARREYRTILPARVQLLVRQYERVQPGQVLVRLDSPDWRRMQHEAVEAEGEIKVAESGIDVAEAAVAENEKAVELLAARTEALAEANASRADLISDLALARSKSARLAAEARAARVKLAEAREHYASKLRTLAAVLNLPPEQLMQPATLPAEGRPPSEPPGATQEAVPLWRSIDTVEIQAAAAGIVESLAVTSGGWADASSLLLTVVDPGQLRFRATALQADLVRLHDGAPVQIVAPGNQLAVLEGNLHVGLEANPDIRSIELIVLPKVLQEWARPGVTAYVEISTAANAELRPSIPVAAVIQDELTKVFFRRDPSNPDKVIRTPADLGVSDGKWVVVQSGVKVGDEVVVEGVYELKLASGGGSGGGKGHFHADGSWHAAGTPEPGSK